MARLPKSIIKRYGISKKAWAMFRRGRRGTSRSNPKPKRRMRNLARRWFRRRRRSKGWNLQGKAFQVIRLGALAAPGLQESTLYTYPIDKITGALGMYAGYNIGSKKFEWEMLVKAWTPFLGACLATYGIPKLVKMIRRL